MIKISKGLNQLFKTLVASIPSLANVGTLLLLLHFIYGVAGMEMFSTVPKGEFINEHANFDTFYFSLITLFRCSTGESWNGIMHDCIKDQGFISIFYFLTFMLFSNQMFLNIFIAVILENFSNVGTQ